MFILTNNKKIVIFLFSVLLLCILTSCTKEVMEDITTDEIEEAIIPIIITEESESDNKDVTYDFLDVYGNSYTAVLLEDVPMHEYNYDQLNIDHTLYTYEDNSGNITSSVGIDVSKYQGDIDWQQVKEYGIEFAIIRLGFRGYGEEGTLCVDEYYQANIEGALAVGLDVGVYFFSQAITEEEALEEAEFVLKQIEDYDVTMPIVFDTEIIDDEEARTYDVDKQVFTDACIVFCDYIEDSGYDSMIYFNLVWSAFTLNLEELVDYDKWYADYYDEPQYPYSFEIWQYTETGTVPGVDGYVDLNLYFEYK